MDPYHFTAKASSFYKAMGYEPSDPTQTLATLTLKQLCATLSHTEPSVHEYLGPSVTENKHDLVEKGTQGHSGF